MKRIIYTFCAVAALMIAAVSCKAVLDSLATNPVFELAGSTVYDGQSAFLGTTATCKIGWQTNKSDIVLLNYDENGKNCVATFTLANNIITDVEITATNLDDDAVDPYTGTFTVAPWKLTVFQKVGDDWVQVSRTNEDYFLWSERKAEGSNNFKVQMQALKSNGTYEDINNIVYRMKLKNGSHKIDWQGSALTEDLKGESTACSIEFSMDKPSETKNITAKLGTKTKEIRILNK